MLTRQEQAQQKYGGSHTVIDSWLAERQELLVKYCKLAGLPPFEQEKKGLPEILAVNSFCQLLVDYLSAGHFEVYNDLVKQCQEQDAASAALAEQLFPKITATTDQLVDFNDKYSAIEDDASLEEFDTDLSKIGQILELRLEYEDELLQALNSTNV